ncbi:hypothetical protein HZA33_01390 [Candidatus Pacearchaeota archaeon]|nr:hypothetical protein [Candidatus Pacearchaeota archaeon]
MENRNKLMFGILMIFVVLTIAGVNAQIIIKSVDTNPQVVKPGEVAEIKLVVENTAQERIDDIIVKLDLAALPIAPSESSTEKNIERLYSDDTETLIFRIIVLPDAESKIYKIPVQLTYNQTKRDSVISLMVEGKPELDIGIDENKADIIGKAGDLSIRFVNKGSSNIKFLTVKILESDSFDLISSDTYYIGDLKTGDLDTASFKIQPKNQNIEIRLSATYKDQSNKEYIITKTLNQRVYSEEEAKQLGLVKPDNRLMYLLIVAVIILVYVLTKYLRRKRK